jgi:hypothetical protein
MKDQYVGDVKDYFTYGLLRAFSSPELPLVVRWMLTPPDGSRDGAKTDYLRHGRFRHFDPELHDALAAIVASGERRVTRVAELLDARYDEPVQPSLVFFDPDMGFEVASVRRGSVRSDQYLYWRDAASTYARGHSLLVFQHARRRRWQEVLAQLSMQARTALGEVDVRAFVTRHGAAFILLRQAAHELLDPRGDAFVRRWQPEVALWTKS